MNNKKQTSVEWLVDWMDKNQYFIGNDLIQAVEQAKQMEKNQMFDYIKENYIIGENSLKFHQEEFEKYFNNNFNVQQSCK